MKTLRQLVEEMLRVGYEGDPLEEAEGLAAGLTPEQRQEALAWALERKQAGEWGDANLTEQEVVHTAIERLAGRLGHEMLYEEQAEFPFPGARILSLWVAEQVKVQLQMGASTEEILAVVRQVLDDNDKKHGPRPLAPRAPVFDKALDPPGGGSARGGMELDGGGA